MTGIGRVRAERAFATLWDEGRRAVVMDSPPTPARIAAQLAALGLAGDRAAVVLTLDRVLHPRELLVQGERHPAVVRTILCRGGEGTRA